MKSEINAKRYVPALCNGHREDATANAEVFYSTYQNERGKYIAIGFYGKRTKADWFYSFSTEEKLQAHVEGYIKTCRQREERKAEARAAKKAAPKPEVKVGMMFYHSWGYDQTNIDFYQVVEVKGKTTAVLRRICGKTVKGSEGMMCSHISPVKDSFADDGWRSEPMTKRIRKSGDSHTFTMECGWVGETSEDREHYNSWYA